MVFFYKISKNKISVVEILCMIPSKKILYMIYHFILQKKTYLKTQIYLKLALPSKIQLYLKCISNRGKYLVITIQFSRSNPLSDDFSNSPDNFMFNNVLKNLLN